MKTRGQAAGKRDFERYQIRSLCRGLDVLLLVARAERAVSVAEVAELSGLSAVTCYRFLMTLQAEGYVEQDPFSKRYGITPKVLGFGFSYLHGLGYVDRATPFLKQLAEKTKESTSMALLDDTEIVYIARYMAQSVLSINLPVGSRLPACFTAMGYVLMASLSDEELTRRLATVYFSAPNPHGPQTLPSLVERIRATRKLGYAINDQYLEKGIRSAAAPIYGPLGNVVAAINLSAPVTRVSMGALSSKILPLLLRTASSISIALGYTGERALSRKSRR